MNIVSKCNQSRCEPRERTQLNKSKGNKIPVTLEGGWNPEGNALAAPVARPTAPRARLTKRRDRAGRGWGRGALGLGISALAGFPRGTPWVWQPPATSSHPARPAPECRRDTRGLWRGIAPAGARRHAWRGGCCSHPGEAELKSLLSEAGAGSAASLPHLGPRAELNPAPKQLCRLAASLSPPSFQQVKIKKSLSLFQ